MLTVILLVPFIILNTIIFSLYSNASEKEIQNSLSESFMKSANIFESAFSSIENNYLLCSSDAYIQSYMLMPKPDFTATKREIINHISHTLSYMKNSSAYLDSVYLYSTQSNYVLSSKQSNYLPEFSDIAWYEYYKSAKNSRRFVFQTINDENIPILALGYEVHHGKELIGIIVFNLNINTLLEITSGSDTPKETLYILDNNNNKVFSSRNSSSHFDISECKTFNNTKIDFAKKKNFYTFTKRFDDFDYLIVSTYDMSLFYTSELKAHFVLLFLGILSCFLAFLIAVYMSFQFYNSISTIMASLSTLGVPIPNEHTENYDEIKFITENILQNSTSKAQIEQELAQKMMYLQKAQTIALQTQFTPHFLFNTLNHISVTLMNEIGVHNPASRMITILADLLSIALNTEDYTTTLEKEINYAKQYLELECIKHNNNFDVIWNIDEHLYNYTIPKLILQPILENSFKHGINPLRGKRRGKIEISVQKDNGDIVFSITDNGVGISIEKLNAIRIRLSKNELPETSHIGLCNVHQRIQLLFKEHYGCTIYQNNPGVTVNIRMPCKKLPPSTQY